MRNFSLRRLPFLIAVSALVVGLPIFVLVRRAESAAGASPARQEDDDALARRFAEVLAVAGESYVVEVPPEKLVSASIRGMLANLDPHTSFLDTEEYGAMQEKQHGSFFGLGIIVGKRDGKVTVIAPIEGTPAQRLGIRPGDVIAEIEGRPVGDQPIDEVIRQLKGPKGTQVSITIDRPGFDEAIHLTITRAEIPTASVRHAFLAEPGIGFIKLTDFTRTTGREVREAITKLEGQGMKKLVLDLRGNPGGILEQSVEVADLFLRRGELIVYTEGRTPPSYQKYVAPGRGGKTDIPLVVLIDNGSASASEIVTGALQDHDRAVTVGMRSWGKGLVQSVYNLSSGAGLALTTARYYTPSGRCIQRDYSNLLEYVMPEFPEEGEDEEVEIPETSDGKEYRTDSGRTVTGGGGITPDQTVHQMKASKLMVRLLSRGVFFNFAVEWVNRHPELGPGFEVGKNVTDEFARTLTTGKNPLFRTEEEAIAALAAEKPDDSPIRRAILSEIMAAKYGLEAGYRVGLRGDKQFAAALAAFPEAERLVAARSAAAPVDGRQARR